MKPTLILLSFICLSSYIGYKVSENNQRNETRQLDKLEAEIVTLKNQKAKLAYEKGLLVQAGIYYQEGDLKKTDSLLKVVGEFN